MYARALTWWTILRICLEERLVYRGDFALGTLMRFLPIVTQIFLWSAIFAARGNEPIAGFRYEDMVAYYLLTMLARAFSSMPGLSSGIAAQIRTGEIKKFLIQPVDLLGFLFLSRIAHKAAYYSVAIGPFSIWKPSRGPSSLIVTFFGRSVMTSSVAAVAALRRAS